MVSVFFTLSVDINLTNGCIYAGVVGNIPELGDWEPFNAVRATGPRDGEYIANVNLPDKITNFEFKWILFFQDHYIWEDGPNKRIDILTSVDGSACHVSSQFHGPATIEVIPPSNNMVKRSGSVNSDNNVSSYKRFLNPLNWSVPNQILGLGLGFLVAYGIYALVNR